MPLPFRYRTQGGNKIASYDFYDLATGTGYKTFYGVAAYLANAKVYGLISSAQSSIYSAHVTAADYFLARTNAGNNTATDVDFDLNVTTSLTLAGDCYVSVPVAVYRDGAGADVTTTISAILYQVASGGAETQIGSTATNAITFPSVTSDKFAIFSGKIVCPTTVIASGEKIRLTVQATAGGAGNYIHIYHDPKGFAVTATAINTQLTCSLPFRIDL